MIIQVREHISTCFDGTDAETISRIINNILENKNETIIIDFTGIDLFCPAFFDLALTYHLEYMTPKEYNERIQIIGLTESGKDAYDLSYDESVSYYSLTPEARRSYDKAVVAMIEEYL